MTTRPPSSCEACPWTPTRTSTRAPCVSERCVAGTCPGPADRTFLGQGSPFPICPRTRRPYQDSSRALNRSGPSDLHLNRERIPWPTGVNSPKGRLALADGRIDTKETTIIKNEIWADGRLDKSELEFLLDLKKAASSVVREFNTMLFAALKAAVLADGDISAKEANWLRNSSTPMAESTTTRSIS